MSGICGLVDFSGRPVALEELARIAEAARHRGPDGIRHRAQGAAAFCHLALDATAEAASERQPLCTPDGLVWLVADVRLDNREDLIRTLEPSVTLPTSRPPGDGEILLAAFLAWGEDCVERLLGDFAFAVWDGHARTLFCARDPLGVKPLCFARIGHRFCFATEAQQILHCPGAGNSLDETALADYLAGQPQDPGRSFFQQIRRIPPGHRLRADAAGDHMKRYWAPEWIEEIRGLSRNDASDRFREIFQQAVGSRLRTQAPIVGIALSGGLDSPSIAAVAQRQLLVATLPTKKLLTYSFVFDHLTECDERPYIRSLADSAGFETAYIQAEDHWLLDDPELYTASESPFQGWHSCHRQGMRLLANREARVLLTGQGADGLLQGSPLVLVERFLKGDFGVVKKAWQHSKSRGQVPWRDLYRLLLGRALPPGVDAGLRRMVGRPLCDPVPDWITPNFARRTGLAERLKTGQSQGRRGTAHQEIASHFGQAPYEQAVHWLDRIASPFGIEVRHPFLDRRLVESILATPPEQVFELGCYKSLLRQAMGDILPDALRLRRDKTRLGAYVNFSLLEKAAHFVDGLLESPMLAELGLVDKQKLQVAFDIYRQKGRDPGKGKLWFAVTLELWLRGQQDTLGLSTVKGLGRRGTALPQLSAV